MKKGNTPMEFDLKGLFKITVEETKLKEKYTVSSIWKKSVRHLYYQFQFQLVLFRLRLKTLLFNPSNENSFEGHKLISNVQLLLHVTLIKQSLLLTYSTVLVSLIIQCSKDSDVISSQTKPGLSS